MADTAPTDKTEQETKVDDKVDTESTPQVTETTTTTNDDAVKEEPPKEAAAAEVDKSERVTKDGKDEDVAAGDERKDKPDEGDEIVLGSGKVPSEDGMVSSDFASGDEAAQGEAGKNKEGDSGVSWPIMVIAVMGILLAIAVALKPGDPKHNYNSIDDFVAKLGAMKEDFPQQYDVYFNMLRNGGKRHLKKIDSGDMTDLTPQAYLVAGYAGSANTVNCFVERLANAFVDGFKELEAGEVTTNEEEDREKLFEMIKSKFDGKNKFLIVRNIEKLKFKTAQLFMSFADEHNSVATYPQSMILFTTELPFTASGERVQDEGAAGSHFKNVVWGDASVDQSAPLWSRVGNGIMLIHGEESLPEKC